MLLSVLEISSRFLSSNGKALETARPVAGLQFGNQDLENVSNTTSTTRTTTAEVETFVVFLPRTQVTVALQGRREDLFSRVKIRSFREVTKIRLVLMIDISYYISNRF